MSQAGAARDWQRWLEARYANAERGIEGERSWCATHGKPWPNPECMSGVRVTKIDGDVATIERCIVRDGPKP